MSSEGPAAVFLQLTAKAVETATTTSTNDIAGGEDCTAEKAALAAIKAGARGVVVSAAPGHLPHPAGEHTLAYAHNIHAHTHTHMKTKCT